MRSRLARVVGALIAAGLGACVPPEEDRIVRYARDTAMGRIQSAGTLTIAIPDDSPPFGRLNPRSNDPEGFTLDIGRLVATELGVTPEVVAMPPEDMLGLVERDDVDVAFPLTPMTEEAVRDHNFTDPYYVAHQRLLVRSGAGIDDVDDLSGRKACAYLHPETEVALDVLNPAVEAVDGSPDECFALIDDGKVDAVTASDVVLMSMVFRDERLRIVGDELTTEGYGAVVVPGLGGFVDGVVADAIEEGTWRKAYARWIEPYLRAPARPPELTVEEAAALFPSET